MSARRPTLARRLVGTAVDVVSDRAPWLSDRVYRAVSAPLQLVDPMGGARIAEARLDDVRDRVAELAARGRVGRGERQRIGRDLARTAEDLERIRARLPAVQARALTLRLAAYAEVLRTLTARPGGEGRPSRAGEAAVLTGAAGAWTGVLLPVAGTTGAVEGGLAAGVLTALGVTAVRNRRAGRARIGAVAQALIEVDQAVRGPRGLHGPDLRTLDHDRRVLLARARRSGRLDERGIELLRRIDGHLDGLLIRLLEGDLEADVSHLVQATVTSYLPDTLEPFLALADPRVVVRGRPAVVEVTDQLAAIESGLAEAARRPGRHQPETLLLLQGEFLRSKFGRSSL